MQSNLYHIQINIDFSNKQFYSDLFEFMGWELIFGGEGIMGYKSQQSGDLWFIQATHDNPNNYDSYGVNHIGLRVSEMKNVDEIMHFLESKNVEMLFDTPRHRAEFSPSSSQTYYQIMFESPDKVLFEVVYIGDK